jgi:hypothetical protein
LQPPPSAPKFRLRFTDLAPDGIRLLVDWSRFVVGASVFIPTLNAPELIKQVDSIAKSKNWEVEYRERIEGNKLGVRIWRIL